MAYSTRVKLTDVVLLQVAALALRHLLDAAQASHPIFQVRDAWLPSPAQLEVHARWTVDNWVDLLNLGHNTQAYHDTTPAIGLNQVVGVISQPGRPQGRGKRRLSQPSPVELVARQAGFDPEQILCPEKAREV